MRQRGQRPPAASALPQLPLLSRTGGRHHAHKGRAAGFCYSNDVVLAVLQLLGSFRRVMYVDVVRTGSVYWILCRRCC